MNKIKFTNLQIERMNDIDRGLTDVRLAIGAAHFLPEHLKKYLSMQLKMMRQFLGDITDD